MSRRQLHRDLGISYKAAWHLSHRVREAYRTDSVLCQGPAEVDETYVGNRETNKHADRKLRAGRGTVGKTPLVGLKNQPAHAIRVAVAPDYRQVTLQAFVRAHLAPGARFHIDEAAYRSLSDDRHARVHHGGGEYGRGPVHAHGIESFRALFKRGFRGTYHSMSLKYLHRYAREFEGHPHHKADDALQHRACLVQGMEGSQSANRSNPDSGQYPTQTATRRAPATSWHMKPSTVDDPVLPRRKAGLVAACRPLFQSVGTPAGPCRYCHCPLAI